MRIVKTEIKQNATTCNRTLSCSYKQAMMLKRFAAVGLPLGPNI
jgi:hypothetical protein